MRDTGTRGYSARRARSVIIAVVFALVVLTSFAVTPARADTSDFTFDSLTVDYHLGRTADRTAVVWVTETYVARFPEYDQNRGLYIELPLVRGETALGTTVRSVTDESGAPVPWWTESADESIFVLTGDDDYVRGVQTYVIEYTMRDVVQRFNDTNADEFTWNIVGSDHAQRIDQVTARVIVSGEVVSGLRQEGIACYVGARGSRDQCDVEHAGASAWPDNVTAWARESGVSLGDTASVVANVGALEPEEGATISVGFEQGTFDAVDPPATPWHLWLFPALGVLFGVGTIVAVLVIRRRLTRNPDPSPVIVQYTPPVDESVTMSAGVFGATTRALSAHLVDLAVRDKVEFLASGERADSEDLTIALRDTDGLLHDDRRVIDTVFGKNAAPGAQVNLAAFAAKPPPRAATYAQRVRDQVVKRGYRTLTSGSAAFLCGVLAVVCFALVLLLMSNGAEWVERLQLGFGSLAQPIYVASWVIAGLGFFFGIFPGFPRSVLTLAGARHVTYLKGMREYIQLAEADRLRAAQAPATADLVSSGVRAYGEVPNGPDARVVNLYERLLPYAVLFGLEKEWGQVIREAAPAADVVLRSNLVSAAQSATLSRASYAVAQPAATTSSSSGWSGSGSSFSGGGSSFGSSGGGGFSGGGGGGGSIGGR